MDKDGAKRRTSTQVDHLEYVRLRAPKRDGQTLDLPAGSEVAALLSDNLARRQSDDQSSNSASNDFPLKDLQTRARAEAIELAVNWSNQYLPVEARVDANSLQASAPIIFGGHQPTLFHPGVWYKNFRLHQIAQASGGTAINMVVDNDLSGAASIKFPQKSKSRASIGLVAFDAPGLDVPFEMQNIVDQKVFESFGKKSADSIAPLVSDPIVKHLWPEVVKAEKMLAQSHRASTTGHAIAAGRHLLEHAHGLRTLEVPISRLAGSSSFAEFSAYLIENLSELSDAYNQAVIGYRAKHGIRSSAHPVPELSRTEESGTEWLEAPFWIWTDQSPLRKPMFVRQIGNDLEISNSEVALAKISLPTWSHWLVAQNQQIQATGKGIFIRPRALITTMFARLLASDLFVHGIGGAKYDQLTDQIILSFFGVDPPRFVTATGSWRLPTGFPEVYPADITSRKEALRKMRFHPEMFISTADENTTRLIESKHSAIAGRSEQSPLERHRAIESANLELQGLLEPERTAIENEIDSLSEKIRDSQILNSREFSFALHPVGLIDRLT